MSTARELADKASKKADDTRKHLNEVHPEDLGLFNSPQQALVAATLVVANEIRAARLCAEARHEERMKPWGRTLVGDLTAQADEENGS